MAATALGSSQGMFELNTCIRWPISSDTVTEDIVRYYTSLSVFILTLTSGRGPTDFELNAAVVYVLYPKIRSNFITKLVKSRPNHFRIQNIKIIYLKTHNLFIPVPLKEKNLIGDFSDWFLCNIGVMKLKPLDNLGILPFTIL